MLNQSQLLLFAVLNGAKRSEESIVDSLLALGMTLSLILNGAKRSEESMVDSLLALGMTLSLLSF